MTMMHPMHANLHACVEDMVAIQVRDVPQEVRDVLAREARAQGTSLQAYLALAESLDAPLVTVDRMFFGLPGVSAEIRLID